jgi:prepilin-type N-terminal cleavage/methylation domain-containing protein/prepilin-type processing-associated H-X9-DG protein
MQDRDPIRRHAGKPDACAFTLVELLVVVAIIALLIAILLPSLARARQTAVSTMCLSNLRQFAAASHMYAQRHSDRYPLAHWSSFNMSTNVFTQYAWDFTTERDWAHGGAITVRPGLLWEGRTTEEIHQCPAFDGGSNTPADPYTGYNYNTSYVGHGQGEQIEAPVRLSDVRRPSQCALFGDGEYAAGANKHMRAPLPDLEYGDSFSAPEAGTQGYRHAKATDAAFADGHAESRRQRYEAGHMVAEGTGFLSPDNSLYDLK